MKQEPSQTRRSRMGIPGVHVGEDVKLRSEPVVVAGAGPVGMVAALLLARCGVPSVVLEEQPRRIAVTTSCSARRSGT